MNSFLKLLISIVIICIISTTVLYLLENNSNDIGPDDEQNDVENNEKNEDQIEDNENISEPNEELNTLTKEEMILEIDDIVARNELISFANKKEESIGVDILGSTVQGYMNYFNSESINVEIYIQGTSVRITPMPDFLDTQIYYFDSDGNLVMYIDESNTIGGEIKYYFYNGELIDIVNGIEEDIGIEFENSEEIIQRAVNVYNRYLSVA